MIRVLCCIVSQVASMCLNTLLSQYAGNASCVVLVSQVASMCPNALLSQHAGGRLSSETARHVFARHHLSRRVQGPVASLALWTMTL